MCCLDQLLGLSVNTPPFFLVSDFGQRSFLSKTVSHHTDSKKVFHSILVHNRVHTVVVNIVITTPSPSLLPPLLAHVCNLLKLSGDTS